MESTARPALGSFAFSVSVMWKLCHMEGRADWGKIRGGGGQMGIIGGYFRGAGIGIFADKEGKLGLNGVKQSRSPPKSRHPCRCGRWYQVRVQRLVTQVEGH